MTEKATSKNTEKQSVLYRFLSWVERMGNKLPHPFTMFFVLCIIIIAISAITAGLDIAVTHPTSGEIVPAKNLASREGIVYILDNMLDNFTGFAPLGLVLTMMLGIGLAEQVGLLDTFMRKFMLGASDRTILFAVFLIGICGNIASDAAAVIVPSLAGAIFYSTKRNPIVGIAAGYAAACAGFSANLIIAGTDALLAGITQEVAQGIQPGILVNPTVNYYFMIASTIVLTIVGVFITRRYLEPLAGTYEGYGSVKEDESLEIGEAETKGLRRAGITTLIYWAIVVIALIPTNSPLRGEGGSIIPSPFISGIIPFLFIWFAIAGIAYGKTVGAIKSEADVPKHMGEAIKGMSGYIVLVFIIGQFVNYFNWTNLGMIISVKLTGLLEAFNFTGIPLIIAVILISSLINLFIGSGSSKWALLAPVFVPMFMMLDYSPAFAQLIYRIGDSSTNAITPLFPYFPIILGLMKKYDEKSGVGTVMSYMLPYTIGFLGIWIILLVAWMLIGLPIGPGVGIYVG